jgi:hypothetical protein
MNFHKDVERRVFLEDGTELGPDTGYRITMTGLLMEFAQPIGRPMEEALILTDELRSEYRIKGTSVWYPNLSELYRNNVIKN